MATIDKYVIQMDVQGQQNVDRLNKSLSGMGSLIASIGIGAFIANVIRMADAVSDLANATGLAIGEIASFQGALQIAGGKAEDASKMIAAFYQQVDKAANGSEDAQKALAKVGITFKDLGNLSEKDLLAKALETLKEMGPGAERTAAGMDVLGKAFRNIDPKVLEEAFRTGDFSKAEAALQKLADLADKNASNFHNLQIAGAQVFSDLMTMLEPFIGKMEEGKTSVEQFEKIIKGVGIALAISFGASAVMGLLEFVKLMKEFNVISKTTLAIQTAITALQGPKGWAMLAGAALATTAAIVALNKAMGDNNDIAGATGAKPGAGPGNEGPKRKTQLYSDAELQARKQALTTAQQVTLQQREQNKAAQEYQRIINSTIGMQQDESDIIKLNAQLQQDADNKILDLTKQIEIEKSKGRGTNQGIIAELQKQIQETKNNLEVTKQLKLEELAKLNAIKNQRLETQMMYDTMASDLEIIKRQQETIFGQQVVAGKMTEEQAARKLALQNAAGESVKREDALRQQLSDAILAGDSRQEQAINNRIALEQAGYASIKKSIEDRYALEDQKRQSSIAGAKSAIEAITRSMDPYQVALMQVNSVWSNMGTAIDRFVDGTTMKFSDLAKSIIRDLIKIELKAQASKLFSAAGGFLSSIFGFAEGGTPPVNKPSIVGEKGPELFVPKSAGTIIPNNKLASVGSGSSGSSNSVVNYITNNNVSAIDGQSVARFFAENRRTMLGTMQLAQKELPYGNR